MNGRVWVGGSLGVFRVAPIVLIGLTLGACGQGQANEVGPSILTELPVRRDLRITAEATGLVEPIRTVEVKSKASGEILALYVDVGDQVEPGALLVEVDPRDVRNGHNQAQADFGVARARLEIAESQRLRSAKLLEADVITEQEHEGKDLEYANAQAAMVRAEANLELAILRLGDVTIRSPLAGTVLSKDVEEGQVIASASGNVSGGTTLLVMANLDQMQVRTLVDETDVGQIKDGMPATVQVEAYPGRTFQGFVEKIEPQAVVQQSVTMFPVIVLLDNSDGLLRPGMNAEVEVLVSERSNALTLPNNAVVYPQEMAPAAQVLGLDPRTVRFDRDVFTELARSLSGDQPDSGAADQGGAGGEFASQRDSLRARVQRGEISQDSVRALRQRFGGGRARGEGQRVDRRGGVGGGPPGASGGGADRGGFGGAGGGFQLGAGARPAVVFVVAPDGIIEARPILIGLSDWDYTEILAGLEEGEAIALLGAAQLQAQRQEAANRFSRFRGGGPIARTN